MNRVLFQATPMIERHSHNDIEQQTTVENRQEPDDILLLLNEPQTKLLSANYDIRLANSQKSDLEDKLATVAGEKIGIAKELKEKVNEAYY